MIDGTEKNAQKLIDESSAEWEHRHKVCGIFDIKIRKHLVINNIVRQLGLDGKRPSGSQVYCSYYGGIPCTTNAMYFNVIVQPEPLITHKALWQGVDARTIVIRMAMDQNYKINHFYNHEYSKLVNYILKYGKTRFIEGSDVKNVKQIQFFELLGILMYNEDINVDHYSLINDWLIANQRIKIINEGSNEPQNPNIQAARAVDKNKQKKHDNYADTTKEYEANWRR